MRRATHFLVFVGTVAANEFCTPHIGTETLTDLLSYPLANGPTFMPATATERLPGWNEDPLSLELFRTTFVEPVHGILRGVQYPTGQELSAYAVMQQGSAKGEATARAVAQLGTVLAHAQALKRGGTGAGTKYYCNLFFDASMVSADANEETVATVLPDGVSLWDSYQANLQTAFDVTPARLVSGLITERGVCKAQLDAVLALLPEHAGNKQDGNKKRKL